VGFVVLTGVVIGVVYYFSFAKAGEAAYAPAATTGPDVAAPETSL